MLIYRFKTNCKTITLFQTSHIAIPDALRIYNYKEYTIIEKNVHIRWADIEYDIALYRLLRMLSMRIKSKLTLIDRGEIESPLYRLIIKTNDTTHLNQFIDSINIHINGLMSSKYWYLRLITQPRDVQCLSWKHVSDGYYVWHDNLKVNIDIYVSASFTIINFKWNNDGNYLDNINEVSRYANDMYWYLRNDIKNYMIITDIIKCISIKIFNNEEDSYNIIKKYIESHPLKIAF